MSETWTPRAKQAEAWTVVDADTVPVFSRLSFSLESYLGKSVFSMINSTDSPETWVERTKQAETWT